MEHKKVILRLLFMISYLCTLIPLSAQNDDIQICPCKNGLLVADSKALHFWEPNRWKKILNLNGDFKIKSMKCNNLGFYLLTHKGELYFSENKIGSLTKIFENVTEIDALEFQMILLSENKVFGFGRGCQDINVNCPFGKVYPFGEFNELSKITPLKEANNKEWIGVSTNIFNSVLMAKDSSLWLIGSRFNLLSSFKKFDGIYPKKYKLEYVRNNNFFTQVTPILINSNSWKKISSGFNQFLGIKSDGSLWSWGVNIGNELGINSPSKTWMIDYSKISSYNKESYPIKKVSFATSPQKIDGDNKWVDVSAGYYYSTGITDDGFLWGWGSNSRALGTSSISGIDGIQKISKENNWKRVFASFYNTFALNSLNELFVISYINIKKINNKIGVFNTDFSEFIYYEDNKLEKDSLNFDNNKTLNINDENNNAQNNYSLSENNDAQNDFYYLLNENNNTQNEYSLNKNININEKLLYPVNKSQLNFNDDNYDLSTINTVNRSTQTNKWGLIITNSNYSGSSDISNVAYANNDGLYVYNYLIKILGIHENNIIWIKDATNAKFQEIFGNDRIREGYLSRLIKPEDEVIIYYSGHGSPGGVDDPNTYLVPVDASSTSINLTSYPLETFYSNLSLINCKKKIVVFDACFSGSNIFKEVSSVGIKVTNPKINDRNLILFTSSKVTQPSNWFSSKENSLFTYYFLKGINEYKIVDSNGDRTVSYIELFNYVTDRTYGMPNAIRRLNVSEQNPEMIGSIDFNKEFFSY